MLQKISDFSKFMVRPHGQGRGEVNFVRTSFMYDPLLCHIVIFFSKMLFWKPILNDLLNAFRAQLTEIFVSVLLSMCLSNDNI